MSNDLTPREPPGGDGFHGPLGSSLFRSNNYLRWNDAKGWIDRDGLKPPSPLVALAVDEALQKWKDNKPEFIYDKPLPDSKELNAAIPQSEWERGLDGNPRPPWEHVVIVLMVDPDTGKSYRYTAATAGAHIAYDELKEAVITMRVLRGENVVPVINLSERPWDTNWGMRKRPDFSIIDWKVIGGSAQAVPAKPPAPQLPGPAAAVVETPAAPPSETSSTAVYSPTSNPAQPPHQAKPKPPVKPAGKTLDSMGE